MRKPISSFEKIEKNNSDSPVSKKEVIFIEPTPKSMLEIKPNSRRQSYEVKTHAKIEENIQTNEKPVINQKNENIQKTIPESPLLPERKQSFKKEEFPKSQIKEIKEIEAKKNINLAESPVLKDIENPFLIKTNNIMVSESLDEYLKKVNSTSGGDKSIDKLFSVPSSELTVQNNNSNEPIPMAVQNPFLINGTPANSNENFENNMLNTPRNNNLNPFMFNANNNNTNTNANNNAMNNQNGLFPSNDLLICQNVDNNNTTNNNVNTWSPQAAQTGLFGFGTSNNLIFNINSASNQNNLVNNNNFETKNSGGIFGGLLANTDMFAFNKSQSDDGTGSMFNGSLFSNLDNQNNMNSTNMNYNKGSKRKNKQRVNQ